MKKGNTKLTISVNERVTKAFKKLCEEEGWKVGKQIEKYMGEVITNR